MIRSRVWFFFAVAAVAMFAFLGDPPVQRTQEARVMETAREMIGHGWRDWIVPHLNGQVRLQKPPLAYWMAAAGFELGGVTDGAGRALFAVCGLGSLVTCFLLTRRLFDERIALLATAMLLGSYLFFRYTRLAETDAPAALFVTIAIAAIMAAITADVPRRRTLLYHLSAVGMALAGLAKGPPLFFPIVFLLFASFAVRSNLLWRFIRSGAPITLLVIVLPWYVYIIHTFGLTTFRAELNNNLEGGDHGGPAYNYAPWLLMGLLPWTIFAVLAFIGLGQSIKRGAPRELKLLIAWIAAIALPLMFTGNRQVHYLLPLMPPLIVMTAWWVSLAVFGAQDHLRKLGHWTVFLTAAGALVFGVAMSARLKQDEAGTRLADYLTPLLVAIGGLIALAVIRRSLANAMIVLIGTFVIAMPLATGYLAARLMKHDPREVATEIRERFGDSPLVFYAPTPSLSLCYNLRQAIPTTNSPSDLIEMQQKQSSLVVISQEKSGRVVHAPPAPFVADGAKIVTDDQVFTFYRVP